MRFGLLDFAARRRRYEAYRDRLAIIAPRPDAAITTLSGGNQQKVLMARWLLTDAKVLLLFDVTRGVDAATKHDIYELVADLARQLGAGHPSSEIEEILLLCHRVLVFREHQLASRRWRSDGQRYSDRCHV
jgi:ribose transport system ATP-binding protein